MSAKPGWADYITDPLNAEIERLRARVVELEVAKATSPIPRLCYDGDESIYVDTARPVMVDGVRQFEECDPIEVCNELVERIAALEAERERLRARVAALEGQLLDQGMECVAADVASNRTAERIAALEADRERLDWLWAHTHGNGTGELDDTPTEWVAMWSFSGDWPADIREAIDAARKAADEG